MNCTAENGCVSAMRAGLSVCLSVTQSTTCSDAIISTRPHWAVVSVALTTTCINSSPTLTNLIHFTTYLLTYILTYVLPFARPTVGEGKAMLRSVRPSVCPVF